LKAVLNSPKELFIVAIDKHFCFLGFSDEYISFARKALKKEVAIGMDVFEVLPEELKGFARKNYERALNGESFVTNNSIVLPV